MKQKSTGIKILLGIVGIVLVVVFSFVPLVNMSYETVVQKQVTEEYTTIEPYTVQEEITETDFVSVDPKRYPVPLYRRVTKDITHYREVTKTRLVYRPVVETQTKRVSLLRYLLR